MPKLNRSLDRFSWNPPSSWRRIRTIDAHTAGEPLRIILEGFPELQGDTILERRRDARTHHDHVRTALMWEPRGHADMYGCLITPPERPDSDFGVLFLHNEGWSSMCGHGIIAVSTVLLETGLVTPEGRETILRIDSPAGLIVATAVMEDGRVSHVRFRNVPSFVLALDETIDVPGLGSIRYDIAYGGAFYAYVHAEALGLTCAAEEVDALVSAGRAIKHAIMASREIPHPFSDDLSFLYGTIFIGPPLGDADSRNVCIFAEGEVDRSPTGTGVSARMALHHARGELALGQSMRIESILGTSFVATPIEEATFGPHAAVIPEVEGSAHITGMHTFVIDPEDPLREGFILR